jgi:hypothetical protein
MVGGNENLLPPDDDDEVLDPPEYVAQELSCSEGYLAKLRMTGDGPPFVKVRKLIRYPRGPRRKWRCARTYTSTSGSRPTA